MSESIPLKRRGGRISATLKALLRARITQGLLVVLPVFITYYLVNFVLTIMLIPATWIVRWFLSSTLVEKIAHSIGYPDWRAITGPLLDSPSEATKWGIWFFSLFLTVFLLYVVGLLTANIVGRRVFEFFEHLLDRVPLVKTVYRATKQMLGAFAGEQSQSFQRVALIPLFSKEVKSLGFVTNTFREEKTGEEWCAVFYFTTPNPTTGYTLIVKREDVIELDWTVEEAVRMLMSGGLLVPEGASLMSPRQNPTAREARVDG